MDKSNYRKLAEEIIFQLADIVNENKYLRNENKKLRKEVEEANQERFERFKASEEATNTMLKALFVGMASGSKNEEDMELAKELCER